MAVPHRIGDAADPRLQGPMRALPWADEALCAQTDPDLWYPEKAAATFMTIDGDRVSHAKAICRRCQVRTTCLDYAMGANEEYGIWGGLTTNERDQLRARRNRKAKA